MFNCKCCTKVFGRAAELGRHNQTYKGNCARFWPYKRPSAAAVQPVFYTAAAAAGENQQAVTTETTGSQAGTAAPDVAQQNQNWDFGALSISQPQSPRHLQDPDSARVFLRLVHGWANGAGMAQGDLQNLLTFIHNPNVDLQQVCCVCGVFVMLISSTHRQSIQPCSNC